MQVLVANDARLLTELRATALGRDGFSLHLAHPERDVAEQAAELAPAAILLADGEACPDPVGVCHRLRARPETCTTPLIVVGLAFHRRRLEAAGVDAFVPRPLRRGELHEALGRILAIEPRAAVRRAVELPARVRDEAAGRERTVTIHDLSLSGAFLTGEELPEPGSPARLAVTVAGRPLELPAHVVRRGRGRGGLAGAALKFEAVDTATRIFLGAIARQAIDLRPFGFGGGAR